MLNDSDVWFGESSSLSEFSLNRLYNNAGRYLLWFGESSSLSEFSLNRLYNNAGRYLVQVVF